MGIYVLHAIRKDVKSELIRKVSIKGVPYCGIV